MRAIVLRVFATVVNKITTFTKTRTLGGFFLWRYLTSIAQDVILETS